MTAALCVGCGEFSDAAVLVRIIETGSGPGGMLYACPACRPRYPGGPQAETIADAAEQRTAGRLA